MAHKDGAGRGLAGCPSASGGNLPRHRRLGALRLALMASFVPPLLSAVCDGTSDGCESDRLLLLALPAKLALCFPAFF